MLKKILKWINEELELALAAIFLAGMVVLGFLQIACRYLPISPFIWTEELIRYLFVWLVFIPIGVAVKQNQHIRITFLKNALPPKGQLVLDVFSVFCCVLFGALCLKTSIDLVTAMIAGGQVAATMPWFPTWILYLVMPISFILIMIRGIQNIILQIRAACKKEEG